MPLSHDSKPRFRHRRLKSQHAQAYRIEMKRSKIARRLRSELVFDAESTRRRMVEDALAVLKQYGITYNQLRRAIETKEGGDWRRLGAVQFELPLVGGSLNTDTSTGEAA